MDEVKLHLTQKIELLQVWLTEVVQKGKELVDTTTQEIIASESFILLEEYLKDLITRLINRGTLTACCFGFTVGSGVGLALGFCLQGTSKPIYMMRAVAATNFTGPDGVAVLDDIPVPSLKLPNQILVEVRYATFCQTDLRIANGYARVLRSIVDPSHEPPVVLGRSGSGTIVEVGGSVDGYDPGDKVIFWCPVWKRGCLSQYVLLSSWQVAPLPKGVSLEDGAWSAYPSVLAWKYLHDSCANTRELHSKKVFVHCCSNWIGDAVRRVVATHGCEASATTSQTPADSNSPSLFFPLSTAPLLMTDPLHRHKYDYVFNTEGEAAEEFSHCLVNPFGKVVKAYPPVLISDTFGAFLTFLYSFWVRFAHRSKWELEGMREGSRLVRSLGRAPLPAQSPHALDPSLVAVSSLGAVLVSMSDETSGRKKMDSIK